MILVVHLLLASLHWYKADDNDYTICEDGEYIFD